MHFANQREDIQYEDIFGQRHIVGSYTWNPIKRAAVLGGTALSLYGVSRMPRFRKAPFRARRSAATKIQARYKGYRQRKMSRKRGSSGKGVTFEHDRQGIYRKSYMPRGKKRRWQRFRKKVYAVSEKELGSRTVVINQSIEFSNTTVGDQLLGQMALYPGISATTSQFNDLKKISSLENIGDPTAAAGATIGRSTKFLFQSGVLDITMRNTSDFNNESLNSEATLETDIYELSVGRGKNADGFTYSNLTNYFAKGSTDTGNIGGAGTEITIGKRGCTPFDVPFALSNCRIKILKKTKMFIRSGQTSTYQVRDPKRHVISKEGMEDLVTCNKPGWTRMYLVIAKAVPGITVGSTPSTTTRERLQIGITRKYLYKIEGINLDRDQYITNPA